MAKKRQENTEEKKRSIPLLVKCLAALLPLFLLCGIVCAVYMRQQTNPDYIAERYMEAFMSKNPTALFHFLGLKRSSFVNEEAFGRFLEESYSYSRIKSYGLTRDTSSADDGIHYRIEFRTGPHSSPVIHTLRLIKSGEKRYLIFDNWIIDHSEYLAGGCSIRIPAGAAADIDGVSLTEEQKVEERDQLATYAADTLFTGTHKIAVHMPGFQDYTADISLKHTDNIDNPLYTVTPSMLSITEDTGKELAAHTEEMIRSLYSGALENQSPDWLHNKFPFEESVQPALGQKYNTLINQMMQPASRLSGVEFREFSSSCVSAYAEDGCYAVKVTTSADYTASSTVSGSNYKKNTPGHSVFITTMHYRDGKWLIHDSTVLESPVYYLK